MDLSTVDPAIIQARGEYATVNGAYKDTMEKMQTITQLACDHLRMALQNEGSREDYLNSVFDAVTGLGSLGRVASELKSQKDALYQIAWGKK
jgi:predicted RNA methylase